MNQQKILIYDLETSSVDVHSAVPRIMGFYSSLLDGFHWTADVAEMVALLNGHDVIVGYNNEDFDDEIMRRYGYKSRGKVTVDLMKVVHGKGFGADKGRKMIIKTKRGLLNNLLTGKSLNELVTTLGGPEKIGDFDYRMLQTARFTDLSADQQAELLRYLERDLEMTKFLYKWIEDFFEFFAKGTVTIAGQERALLSQEQIEQKKYITASVGALSYFVLCNLMGVEPTFAHGAEHESYEGGYVALPTQETVQGDIYCIDFTSLYPHINIMCNLHAPGGDWNGGELLETQGTYSSTEQSAQSFILQELFLRRAEMKVAKDPREYMIKIVLNTVYGIAGNPAFEKFYSVTGAADCTRIGREWIKFARRCFEEAGYPAIYTDTDSVYVQDKYADVHKLLAVRDKIVAAIKANVPFPSPTFDMSIDDEIEWIAFFQRDGRFNKKHYMYVTKDNNIVMKGIPFVRNDCSKLGLELFKEMIEPRLLYVEEVHRHKISARQVELKIIELLQRDIMLAAKRLRCRDPSTYDSKTGLNYKVAEQLGEGTYDVIKLKHPHPKGLGGGKNYVLVEDAGDVRIQDIDLSKTWSEMELFIKSAQRGLNAFL